MKIWMAVLASGLCVIACFLWSLRDGPPEPAARAPAARAAKPLVMAPPSSPPPTLDPVRPAPAVPATAEPVATSDSAEPPRAEPSPTRGDMREGLETFFQNDRYDPAWSQRTTETLTQGIHAVLPSGSRLQRLECRGTLCRIETSHADLDAYRTYTQDAFMGQTRLTTGAAFGTVVGEPVPGRPVVAVAFVARDGNELPDLEPPVGAR
jgi:hypothetical protein